MSFIRPACACTSTRLSVGVLLALLSLCPACKQAPPASQPLDQMDMWSNNVAELRELNVSNAEITELTTARNAGLSDPSCVTLIKIARSRQKPFSDGQPIADLLSAGASEQTVLELSRLNQLGLWAGQARILRLAGQSDKVILAVAKRRSQGLPVLSETTLNELKNAGTSEATILDFIEKGLSEQEATQYITQRERAAGGQGFVYQRRGRRRS